MDLNLTTCDQCGVLIDRNQIYTHQSSHHYTQVECSICAALVPNHSYQKHIDYHERQRNVEVLLDRLLGDIHAHLDFLQRDEQFTQVVSEP